MLQIAILFLVSLIISYCVIQLAIWGFKKLDILDNPKKFGKERAPIPYSTGIVFFISFFLISYFTIEHNSKLYLIWVFGGLITLMSFIDDMVNVSAKKRLIVQIIIGAIIGVTSIKIGYISNIFGGILNLETYNIAVLGTTIYIIPLLFTIIWYVFIFNALNWTDGISGNTSGLSIISFGVLFLLGMILFFRDSYDGGVKNAEFIMQMTCILIGILLPFWYYDVQEKILMGDSGTMFLGFMLASIAIISGGKIATVLVVFGIYAVDAVYVIIKRLLKGKSPTSGDLSHIHHRLLQLGLSRKEILVLLYSLSLLFGIMALFLDKFGKMLIFVIIIFVVIFISQIVDTLYLQKKKGKGLK